MAVAWKANGDLSGTSSSTTLPIVAPVDSVAPDDIFIAAILGKDSQVVTAPAGWSLVYQYGPSSTHAFHIFWKRVVAGDAGQTFNFTRPVPSLPLFCGFITCFSGCRRKGSPIDAATPSHDYASNVGGTRPTNPLRYATFDPAESLAFVVALGFFNGNPSSIVDITGTNPLFIQRFTGDDPVVLGGTVFMSTGTSNGAATGARTQIVNASPRAEGTGVLFGLVEYYPPTSHDIGGAIAGAHAGSVGLSGIAGAVQESDSGTLESPKDAAGSVQSLAHDGEVGTLEIAGELQESAVGGLSAAAIMAGSVQGSGAGVLSAPVADGGAIGETADGRMREP